jgi:hypothetical protein
MDGDHLFRPDVSDREIHHAVIVPRSRAWKASLELYPASWPLPLPSFSSECASKPSPVMRKRPKAPSQGKKE